MLIFVILFRFMYLPQITTLRTIKSKTKRLFTSPMPTRKSAVVDFKHHSYGKSYTEALFVGFLRIELME